MSSIDEQHDQRKVSRRQRQRAREDELQSSKLGYVIIVACVAIMLIGMVVTQQFDQRDATEPRALSAQSVNADALSSTWSCPLSGSGQKSDSLLLTNPDSDREAVVDITVFDGEGKQGGAKNISVPAGSTLKLPVVEVGATDATSLVVESFASSLIVFRSLALSDGTEIVPCVNDFVSQADFPNLETLRNSNSVLVLANPYAQTVVVDITASLLDTTATPPLSVLDDVRGIIIPAHGRVNFDLQAEFGRYSIVSTHIESRSGFFAAEALMTYTGAESAQGQTVVPRAEEITGTSRLNWTGVSPTRIVTRNDSSHTYSIQLDALASDQRSINGEAQTLSGGTTTLLTNVGTDFLTRVMNVGVEKSAHTPSDVFTSWIHASATGVSSGSSRANQARHIFVPTTISDSLHLYNPGDKSANVTVTVHGTSEKMSIKIPASSYVIVSPETTRFMNDLVLEVNSTTAIYASTANAAFSRHAQGIDVRP